jgi:SAM-dependent methyltransferase
MTSAATYHGFELRYDCDRSALRQVLRERFVALSLDDETRAFIDAAPGARHGRGRALVHRALRPFLSDFDINGLLGTYPLFFLSVEQWALLLDRAPSGRLLDIGAASGEVTSQFASRFEEVRATETSQPMARRLRRRGIPCDVVDVSGAGVPDAPYDVVCCLNVIDRCDRPRTLLKQAYGALRSGGWLVVATPLPLAPFVYVGGATLPPAEPISADGPSWELSAGRLWHSVLSPLGGRLVCFTRAPYLSIGDNHSELYVLDDAAFVIEKP